MIALADHLQALETELHHPGVRCTAQRLEQLLHPDFHEVGRSGRAYTRATVIAYLVSLDSHPRVEPTAFRLSMLGPTHALLTYRSAHRGEDGALREHTLRSSIWALHDGAWKLLYHQGTPAAEAG